MPSDGEDEEEPVCRVCHGPAEDEEPLFHPCKCSGSIKWVHQACLLEWLRVKHGHSNARRCELCHSEFVFTPLYRDDTPARLSPWEFAYGLCQRAVRLVVPTSRVAVLLACWLGLLPLLTIHTSRWL